MKTLAIRENKERIEEIKNLVISGMSSKESKIAYGKGLDTFLNWFQEKGKQVLNKATVLEYRAFLEEKGLAPATINLRLTAIRRLIVEMIDNNLIEPYVGQGILRVKGIKTSGVRTGNWLDKKTANKLLRTPDLDTLKGIRDRAILGIAIGSGLRRSEISNLKIEDIQQREGRWVILDLVGKRKKVRTVPISSWVKVAVDLWIEQANITEGFLFRSMRKGGSNIGDNMSSQAVQDVIVKYSGVSAHDLRRTFAKLAHKGGCPIEQIQLSLGHENLKNTEDYLGIDQDLTSAPSDYLGLRLQ